MKFFGFELGPFWGYRTGSRRRAEERQQAGTLGYIFYFSVRIENPPAMLVPRRDNTPQ